MDLKTFETTSTLAIEAVYMYFWNFIPQKYKLPEDDERVKDLYPFYDPELSFDNRLHYKLSNISYPNRSKPWFIITWNTEQGLVRSSLTQRRFQGAVAETEKYGKVRYKFINAELIINFGICSNTMQGLFELQENLILQNREKMVVLTKPHSILGKFPISLNIMDTTQSKLTRDKGTLCYLFLNCKVDYPIVGMVQKTPTGTIEEIHSDLKQETNEGDITLTSDIITEED